MTQPAAASSERFRHLRASLRLWGETLRALARSPGAVAGGILFALIIGTSLCFQLFYTKDPLAQDLLARLTPPFWQEGAASPTRWAPTTSAGMCWCGSSTAAGSA